MAWFHSNKGICLVIKDFDTAVDSMSSSIDGTEVDVGPVE
jgi:hypothetical protein